MKKFVFTLERVLDWRRLQTQIAEAELERLSQAHRTIEQQKQLLAEHRQHMERELLESQSATGWELAALEAFQNHTDAERGRLDKMIAAAAQKIQNQKETVIARRREARLLEHLKEKRLGSWRKESLKETDQLAEDAYLARWKKK